MDLDKDFLNSIEELLKYYKEKEVERENLLKTLTETIYKIKPEFFLNLETKPHYNFGRFTEPFKKRKISLKENFEYTIAAVDGSRITINEEFPVPFFVIQTACIFESILQSPQYKKDIRKKFFFKDEDIFDERSGIEISADAINLKMLLAESAHLDDFIKTEQPQVALIDGSLVLWGLKKIIETVETKEIIRAYTHVLTTAKSLNIPIAGYISGSRSKEVVKSIALFLEEHKGKVTEDTSKCINDIELMDELLEPYEISSIFSSTEQLILEYREKIYFFFLKTKYEVARIEIPEYVYKSQELFDLLINVVINEIEKGDGYPNILKLAHFEADLKKEDKNLIESFIIQKLNEAHIFNSKYLFKLTKQI